MLVKMSTWGPVETVLASIRGNPPIPVHGTIFGP